jgi:hypothetical protein
MALEGFRNFVDDLPDCLGIRRLCLLDAQIYLPMFLDFSLVIQNFDAFLIFYKFIA